MSASDKILYPNQLKPCTEDLRDDELIRRLKVCEKIVVVFFQMFILPRFRLDAGAIAHIASHGAG